MQNILKNFEKIKQFQSTKQIDGKQIDCQIYANKSILIGDLSNQKLEGYYEFVYRSKFYIQGHISNDQFKNLSIQWRDDLYFKGILNFTQQKFDGEIFYKDLIKIKINPNTQINELDQQNIELIDGDSKELQLLKEQKNEKTILKILIEDKCIAKIKQKKFLQFTFYQYSTVYGKKSSISFQKPFAFKKKLYKNEKKIKEKIINFYEGQAKTKHQIDDDKFSIKSLLNMRGFKIHFNKMKLVKGYTFPMFKNCLYFGLTVKTHYNKKDQQIEDINIEYHSKQSNIDSNSSVQLKNFKILKYLAQIDFKDFQSNEFNFENILNKLSQKYGIIQQVIEELFMHQKIQSIKSEQKETSNSNIIICSDNEICNYSIKNQQNSFQQSSQKEQNILINKSNFNKDSSEVNLDIIDQQDEEKKNILNKSLNENNIDINLKEIEIDNDQDKDDRENDQIQIEKDNFQNEKKLKTELKKSQNNENQIDQKQNSKTEKISKEDENINHQSNNSSNGNLSNFEFLNFFQNNKQNNYKKISNSKELEQQPFQKFELRSNSSNSLIKENNYSSYFKLKFQKGTFKNNKLTGNCIEIFDKYYYNGIFKKGKRNGQGYLVEQDEKQQGDYFQFGNFKENKKCGQFLIQKNSIIHKVIIENDKFYQLPKKEKYLGVYRKFYNHKNKDDILIEGQGFEFYGKFDQKSEKFFQQNFCILKRFNNDINMECQCQLLEQENIFKEGLILQD